MTDPVYSDSTDKVTITCYYGDDGRCKQITIYLNDDTVTPEDIAACIRTAVTTPADPGVASIIPRHTGTRDFDANSAPGRWWGN